MKTTSARKQARENAPKREGDVLGISDSGPDATIPVKGRGTGHPAGVDVRRPSTGLGDVPQRDGAAGVDMGGGGEGTDVSSETLPHGPQPEDEDA
jgi:hypothetical protein